MGWGCRCQAAHPVLEVGKMAANNSKAGKRYFTPAEANATLPLVRAIVRDVMTLFHDLRERDDRLSRTSRTGKGSLGSAYQEELQHVQEEIERDQERMQEYVEELKQLGVELKDPVTGLIDFPCWMDDHEVYLCWRYGEPDVGYWHELDAGFAGRQKLMAPVRKS
jgi:hypothetical protein